MRPTGLPAIQEETPKKAFRPGWRPSTRNSRPGRAGAGTRIDLFTSAEGVIAEKAISGNVGMARRSASLTAMSYELIVPPKGSSVSVSHPLDQNDSQLDTSLSQSKPMISMAKNRSGLGGPINPSVIKGLCFRR